MRYDLHVHTTASDGVNTPAEVITMAAATGLAGLAITDHDTLDGLIPALTFVEENNLEIELIPGIELNTDYGEDEVHILGYYIDCQDQNLKERLAEIRRQRYLRAEKMIDKLNTMGLKVEFDEVHQLAQGDIIGRPHIARVLCRKGYVNSEEEAFLKYIGHGQPAYVPRYKFKPAEAIELIKQAGGISVLAHPGLIKNHDKIRILITLGIEGLEIYYPEHSDQQIIDLTRIAQQNNLLITGGSDYHGSGSLESRSQLGAAYVGEAIMCQIRRYGRQNMK